MKPLIAALLTSLTFAAPALGQGAKLEVDPARDCYPARERVFLFGSAYTPNSRVDFSRDGEPLEPEQPIVSDAAGGFSVGLTLPGMISGQRRLSYVVTDSADPSNSAGVDVLITATSVALRPVRGAAKNRRITIAARGFFGGSTLYGHVRRDRGRQARTVRIGRVRGACQKVRARRRLFSAEAPPGRYVIQFDTFRRYRDRRGVEYEYPLTIAADRD